MSPGPALLRYWRAARKLRVEASQGWFTAARKPVRDPDRLVATIKHSFPYSWGAINRTRTNSRMVAAGTELVTNRS